MEASSRRDVQFSHWQEWQGRRWQRPGDAWSKADAQQGQRRCARGRPMNLTKEQRAQIREAARGMNQAEVENFETAVIGRLQKMVDGGVTITTPNVSTACSEELARGTEPNVRTNPLLSSRYHRAPQV